MWHDTWSPWLILSIIVYGIILFCAIKAAGASFQAARRWPIPKAIVASLAVIALLGGAWNAITYRISSDSSTISSSPNLTESFGFRSGQVYSLIAGERFGGSIVDARGTRWSFTIQSLPASAISVSFAGANNKFYIFDIPLNKVTFTQQEDVAPTMTLNLRNDDINAVFSEIKHGKRTPCQIGFKALMLTCHSNTDSARIPKKGVIEQGLSPLVMNYLDNAQLTVTQKMYDRILGKSG
jgi:hypothetical protein